MLRLGILLVVLGLIAVFVIEMIRHDKKAKLNEELNEEERDLALKQEQQIRQKRIRRTRSSLKAEDKASEIDDVLSTINLNEKEEK